MRYLRYLNDEMHTSTTSLIFTLLSFIRHYGSLRVERVSARHRSHASQIVPPATTGRRAADASDRARAWATAHHAIADGEGKLHRRRVAVLVVAIRRRIIPSLQRRLALRSVSRRFTVKIIIPCSARSRRIEAEGWRIIFLRVSLRRPRPRRRRDRRHRDRRHRRPRRPVRIRGCVDVTPTPRRHMYII